MLYSLHEKKYFTNYYQLQVNLTGRDWDIDGYILQFASNCIKICINLGIKRLHIIRGAKYLFIYIYIFIFFVILNVIVLMSTISM